MKFLLNGEERKSICARQGVNKHPFGALMIGWHDGLLADPRSGSVLSSSVAAHSHERVKDIGSTGIERKVVLTRIGTSERQRFVGREFSRSRAGGRGLLLAFDKNRLKVAAGGRGGPGRRQTPI